jgi:hypothetical protein
LLPQSHPLRKVILQSIQDCDRLLALDRKLTAVLNQEATPADAAERLALAELCGRYQKRYATAARFYQEAFAEGAGRSNDLKTGHRYLAARSAALASIGEGKDDPAPDATGRIRWRKQAFDWLRADLTLLERHADNPQERPEVRKMLPHWQQGPTWRACRDPTPLAKLPEAERQAWRQLWADVVALLKRLATIDSKKLRISHIRGDSSEQQSMSALHKRARR